MAEKEKKKEQGKGTDNTIFIGEKPFMNYVTSVIMQFTTKEEDIVFVKARGKFINKAVDVVEVARNRFLENKTKVKDIEIDSEEFENKEGRKVRVSTISIEMIKVK